MDCTPPLDPALDATREPAAIVIQVDDQIPGMGEYDIVGDRCVIRLRAAGIRPYQVAVTLEHELMHCLGYQHYPKTRGALFDPWRPENREHVAAVRTLGGCG